MPIGGLAGKAPRGLPRQTLTKQGWPDLPAKEAINFTSAEAVTLPPGTRIYRILDPQGNPAGSYWAEGLPASRAAWRRDYAVKTDWNVNGRYVEHTVPDGPGLRVWRGGTAAQQLEGSPYYLPGGAQQIWMPPDTEAVISAETARELERASTILISRIREAVRAFHADPPAGWQAWEEYRTPSPWERRAIVNLTRYHAILERAVLSLSSGDPEPLVLMAASYTGLSKDLDFDMNWMTPAHRDAVNRAVDDLVAAADRIREAGAAETSEPTPASN